MESERDGAPSAAVASGAAVAAVAGEAEDAPTEPASAEDSATEPAAESTAEAAAEPEAEAAPEPAPPPPPSKLSTLLTSNGFTEGDLRAGDGKNSKKILHCMLIDGEIAMFSARQTFALSGVFDVPDRPGCTDHRVDFKLAGVEHYKTVNTISELFCATPEEKQQWLESGTVLPLTEHPKYPEFAYAMLPADAVVEALEERGLLGMWGSRLCALLPKTGMLEVYDKVGGGGVRAAVGRWVGGG
jgi:hypothetical protein